MMSIRLKRLPTVTWRVISIAAIAVVFLIIGAVVFLPARTQATKLAGAELAADPPAAIASVIALPKRARPEP